MTAIATGDVAVTLTEAAVEVGTTVETSPRARQRRILALCLLAYAVLAVLVFLPNSPLSTTVLPSAGPGNPAGSDPFQMTWFLAWAPYAISHGLNLFHTNLIEYPYGVNLADNTTVPLLGVLAWPVTATLGPVASFNLLIRLAFALSGASMFFVLRRWCRSWIAPFVGGLLYAFGPYTSGQELHLDLAFVPIPPLLIWCADELLRRQKMRPSRLGLLIGAAASAQFLISPDVLSGCVVLAACGALALGLRHRRLLAERLPYIARAAAFAASVVALILGWPLFEMVAGAGHLTGAVIPPGALQIIRSDLLGPIVPTSHQLVAPHFVSRIGNEFADGNLSENGTYLGLPLVVLLAVVIKRLWRNAIVRTFAWLMLGAFVISLGNKLTIGTATTIVPLPEAIFAHLPLLDNTIPARYSLYVLLFASMILAIGLDQLWVRSPGALAPARDDAAPRRRFPRLTSSTPAAHRARLGLVAAVTALLLIPSVPFHSRPLPWPTNFVPTVDRIVPAGTVVLTYPYPTPLHSFAMAWEAESGMRFRMLGGYANVQYGGHGQRWPALLSPAYVEELLGYSDFGDHLPLPTYVVPSDYPLLRLFLTRYHIGAVVYWAGGDDRYQAYEYLRAALGPPKVRQHHLAIWLAVAGRWPGPK